MARPKRQAPWYARRGNKDNGIFYAYWYDEEKRAVDKLSLGTSSPDEAAIAFAEFLLNGRDLRLPRPKGLTVELALDDYYNEHVLKHCAASKRQMQIIKHLKEFFGDRQLADVTVPLSQDYAKARYAGQIGGGARRTDKTAAPGTVRRELNVLTAAANHALWMKRDGAVAVSVDLPPEKRLGQDDEAPYYSADEVERIFAAAAEIDRERRDGMVKPVPGRPHSVDLKGDLEVFVKMLYHTGARRDSIQKLGRSQVKLNERRILLQKPGKRSTKKRQPIVPILRSMIDDVTAMLSLSNLERLFEQADYYRPYREACRRAGIDEERSHPHVMRHTRATHLLQDGKSLYDVARLLGDTTSTVERVYGHHSHEHLAGKLEG